MSCEKEIDVLLKLLFEDQDDQQQQKNTIALITTIKIKDEICRDFDALRAGMMHL